MDLVIISYFVAGILCAIGCRMLLRRLEIQATNYWSFILGEGTEVIFITILLWPITLLALVVYYLLKRSADRYDAKLRAADAERRRKEREDSLSTLTLDQLLEKVEEQKKEFDHKS
jgi:hypothetical protein